MDSLGSLRPHWDSFGLTWTRLDKLGLTWVHVLSLELTWTYLDLLGLTWIHLDSLGLTWIHLVSLGLTGTDLDSLGFTWTHFGSRAFCIHMDSLGSLGLTRSHKGKGKLAKPDGKRENPEPLILSHYHSASRQRARTHDKTRNDCPIGLTPQPPTRLLRRTSPDNDSLSLQF